MGSILEEEVAWNTIKYWDLCELNRFLPIICALNFQVTD